MKEHHLIPFTHSWKPTFERNGPQGTLQWFARKRVAMIGVL
jgi:hypothetical protein